VDENTRKVRGRNQACRQADTQQNAPGIAALREHDGRSKEGHDETLAGAASRLVATNGTDLDLGLLMRSEEQAVVDEEHAAGRNVVSLRKLSQTQVSATNASNRTESTHDNGAEAASEEHATTLFHVHVREEGTLARKQARAAANELGRDLKTETTGLNACNKSNVAAQNAR
jgi:hypothetical protein